jgi:N-formylglutamate amidohydrolase
MPLYPYAMIAGSPEQSSFVRCDPPGAAGPVVIAVPHAGRAYSPTLLAQSRLPQSQLERLEDRYADRLITAAIAEGATAIIAVRPRAWIDLNRDEREIDPAMVRDMPPDESVLSTIKSRGGLGLIPRRIHGAGDILRRPLSRAEVAQRVDEDYRPYHAAISTALKAAHRRHGIAVLIDCHSMPSIARPGRPPQIVIGDRFGRSAGSRFAERAVAEAEAFGHPTARNDPYSGGSTLDRHGVPRRGYHALQIEVDRSLYLGRDGRTPGTGLPSVIRLIASIAAGLADESAASWPMAAE